MTITTKAVCISMLMGVVMVTHSNIIFAEAVTCTSNPNDVTPAASTTLTVIAGACPGNIIIDNDDVTVNFDAGAGEFRAGKSIVLPTTGVIVNFKLFVTGVTWAVGQKLFSGGSATTLELQGGDVEFQGSSITSSVSDPIGLLGKLTTSSRYAVNTTTVNVTATGYGVDLPGAISGGSAVTIHSSTVSVSGMGSCYGLRFSGSFTNSTLSITHGSLQATGTTVDAVFALYFVAAFTDSTLVMHGSALIATAGGQAFALLFSAPVTNSTMEMTGGSALTATSTHSDAYGIYTFGTLDHSTLSFSGGSNVSATAGTDAYGVYLNCDVTPGTSFTFEQATVTAIGASSARSFYKVIKTASNYWIGSMVFRWSNFTDRSDRSGPLAAALESTVNGSISACHSYWNSDTFWDLTQDLPLYTSPNFMSRASVCTGTATGTATSTVTPASTNTGTSTLTPAETHSGTWTPPPTTTFSHTATITPPASSPTHSMTETPIPTPLGASSSSGSAALISSGSSSSSSNRDISSVGSSSSADSHRSSEHSVFLSSGADSVFSGSGLPSGAAESSSSSQDPTATSSLAASTTTTAPLAPPTTAVSLPPATTAQPSSCTPGQVETSTARPTPPRIDVNAKEFQEEPPSSATAASGSSNINILNIDIHLDASTTTSTREWWQSTNATPTQPQQVPGDQFAFRLHARPGGDQEKPDASGIASYRPGNTVNLTRSNSTSFTLEFEVGTGYLIYVGETFDVELLPAYFGCRVPPGPVIIATITVSTRPSDIVAETNTAIAVVTGTAMVGAAVGGGAVALDAQTLAVLGLMFCAQPVERETLKNNRLLSPLATSNTYEGMILGNWIIIAAILTLHVAAVAIATKVKKMTTPAAMALVRFPAFSLVPLNMQYQGTGAAAIKLAQNTEAGASSLALAWITILMTFAMPVLMSVGVWKGLSVSFHEYLHRTAGSDGDDSSVAVTARLTARPVPKWLKFLLPQGKWMPLNTRRRFGSLFSFLGRYERVWVTLPLWSPTIILIGLCWMPSAGIPCSAMYGTLAAFEFLLALVFLALRPLRSIVANVLAAGSNTAIGVVLVASAVQATSPNSPNARYFTLKAIQAQIGCTGVRLLWSGCQFLMENRVLAKLPMQEVQASRWNAGGAGSGAEDALHGRDDIQQELLTMNNYTAGAAEAQTPEGESRESPTATTTTAAASVGTTLSPMQASTGANTTNGLGNVAVVDPFADSSDDDLDDLL